MNFLGHIYFSNNDHELMYANLFGDFVRGKDLSMYPQHIQNGITLHREIDFYVDHHPAVKELLHKLYPSLPKIAGIAVDLFFDHLLSKNWKIFSDLPLEEFLNNFYKHQISEEEYPNDLFHYTLFRMKQGNWMFHYQTLEGLDKSCKGVSRRISFPNTLFNASEVFVQLEDDIENAFFAYMEDAQKNFKAFHQSLS